MICQPKETIPSYPGLVDGLDYEAELAVIIGKDAKDVPEEKAGEYIFGYTILNDISARNMQNHHGQWYFNDYDRHGNDPVRKDDFRPQCGAITFQKRRRKSPQRRSFSPRMYRETL